MKKKSILLFCTVIILALALSCSPVFAAEAANGCKVIEDLDGRQLGVQTAVCYEDEIKDEIPAAQWQYYQMPNDMIMALEAEKIDAYLIEEVGFAAQKYEHPELIRMDEAAGNIDFVIAVGNNDKQAKLLEEINAFIAACEEDGTTDSMYSYWITNWDPSVCKLQCGTEHSGENGIISVAVEGAYEPFSFVSEDSLEGFDVEFIHRFCDAYGYDVKFYEVPFDSIAAGTEQGKYDLGMNIVLTEERSDGTVLSDVYYSCDIVFVLEGTDDEALGFWQGLADSFNKTFIKENRWKMFVSGTGVTAVITLASMALGTALGFAIYLICRGGSKLANGLMAVFSWLIQGMPTVVLLMILFYIVFGSSSLSGTWISIFGFSLIFACSVFDMLKVGFGAISKGQTEASRALGYSDSQCFFRILLPQAAQHFLPIYKNETVTLIKETSIVGYIAVLDLTKIGDLIRSRTYEAFFALIATAVIYFIIETVMIFIVKRVQISIDPHRRPDAKVLKGIVVEE